MAVDKIIQVYDNVFKGVMKAPKGELLIGDQEKGLSPYNLLLGALGSCYYHTFVEIAKKKRLTFDGANVEITGKKRTVVPTTLETALIKIVIKNASDEKKFVKTAELAADNCSIHATISKVAKIDLEVAFE